MPIEEKTILEIKIPRENEYTPESAAALFSSFTKTLSSPSVMDRIMGKKPENLVLEIASINQEIHFFVILPQGRLPFFESQILAAYPLAVLNPVPDYLGKLVSTKLSIAQIGQSSDYYYPIRTYKEFTNIDPLSAVLSVMSKAKEDDIFILQYILEKASSGWQKRVQKLVDAGIKVSDTEKKPLPQEAAIKTKIIETGLWCGIRIASNNSDALKAMAGSFAAFSRGDGNSIVPLEVGRFQKKKFDFGLFTRSSDGLNPYQIFNVSELATLWHLPSNVTKVPNIAWGRSVLTEAPDNLPAALDISEEEKNEINFFAQTTFKNRLVNFGIKHKDRRRHMYIIGKTGCGKSTLIANMAIDDLHKGKGLAVIDPHGDLTEILLNYVPANRINDVIYLDPSDKDHPFSINVLEVKDPSQAELAASGIVSIFYKLYAYSWGPRLEHILRNTLLTLAQIPGSTLVDVPLILTNKDFRREMLSKLTDNTLQDFWYGEFEQMTDKLLQEAISPILNKVGQFVSSPSIRAIISQPKSTIDLEQIMNEGKVLLLNLSQGKLGEDNAALLGAMIITKFQLAAMNRVKIPEEERRDFYLYVDEFQNFATTSFVKILSEARKYRLDLCLANQYMAQLEEPVQRAIFGNAGTIISYVVGAQDASILEGEFGGIYTAKDLVGLSNFQMVIKLTIDNLTSRPFFAYALPLPNSTNENREKVIQASNERYSYDKSKAASVRIATTKSPQSSPPPRRDQPRDQRPKEPPRPEGVPSYAKLVTITPGQAAHSQPGIPGQGKRKRHKKKKNPQTSAQPQPSHRPFADAFAKLKDQVAPQQASPQPETDKQPQPPSEPPKETPKINS